MSARLRRLRERFPMVALGLEVFSIVLGVLLALGVNEWREARAEDDVRRARLGFPRGGQFAPLFSSAYEAARSSGALAHVDYETLGLLSSICQMQK